MAPTSRRLRDIVPPEVRDGLGGHFVLLPILRFTAKNFPVEGVWVNAAAVTTIRASAADAAPRNHTVVGVIGEADALLVPLPVDEVVALLTGADGVTGGEALTPPPTCEHEWVDPHPAAHGAVLHHVCGLTTGHTIDHLCICREELAPA